MTNNINYLKEISIYRYEFFGSSVLNFNTDLILDVTWGTTTQEIKLEDFEIKEETVSIKEEILPVSTVEDTCTVYVQGEDMKMESTEMKSKKRTEYSPQSFIF